MSSKITIQLEMPDTAAPSCAAPLPKPIEDKVREALERVESGYKSDVTWLMIRKLYTKLQGMKQTPRVENLKKMIEPVLAKYGYHKKGEK